MTNRKYQNKSRANLITWLIDKSVFQFNIILQFVSTKIRIFPIIKQFQYDHLQQYNIIVRKNNRKITFFFSPSSYSPTVTIMPLLGQHSNNFIFLYEPILYPYTVHSAKVECAIPRTFQRFNTIKYNILEYPRQMQFKRFAKIAFVYLAAESFYTVCFYRSHITESLIQIQMDISHCTNTMTNKFN